MSIKDLYQELLKAYTVENLNRISLTLINYYKNQQFNVLQKIADMIGKEIGIEISPRGKGFSKFMMLYHPDRLLYHLNEINRLNTLNDYEGMLKYSHILLLSNLEEIPDTFESYEDIDYSPVYEWDFSSDGYSIINDYGQTEVRKPYLKNFSFYEAVKIRLFGNINQDFPSYYLEDIEEFELYSSEIDDLEGVELCIQAKVMDLSDNMISDLTPLFSLPLLQELNLSDNNIEDISVLSNLLNLKRLKISNNYIEDFSPLFELPLLQYVDLAGNEISLEQVDKLTELGVIVDS
ncbi:MAG: leucine-rich repeat domain-containing protein [Bacteroidota bacterium]